MPSGRTRCTARFRSWLSFAPHTMRDSSFRVESESIRVDSSHPSQRVESMNESSQKVTRFDRSESSRVTSKYEKCHVGVICDSFDRVSQQAKEQIQQKRPLASILSTLKQGIFYAETVKRKYFHIDDDLQLEEPNYAPIAGSNRHEDTQHN
ncbi:hypothetical protein BC940DRAFT_370981 [Gongronella butleri]|nr:hypothetical protein BC940DRAFT_370981 [Gongronella butleri]